MEKIHSVRKALLQFTKSFFVLSDVTEEFMNCSRFLKNPVKHFFNLTCKRTSLNTSKIDRNIFLS